MTEASNWSRGYPVTEIYPTSWHSYQSPAHLRAICALMGVAWDVGPESPLSICEVGCGTAYTGQVMAAGNPHWQVVGLDYNPAHIAEARSMARAAGLDNVRLIEADLAEMSDADLDRLPEFDLVTVHGVWSWVADPVREGVLRLLRRRLKAGGLVFMGYNALPGAAAALGLSRVAQGAFRAAGNSTDGVALATRQVQRLLAAEPAHLPPSGWLGLLSGEVKGARAGYLFHEFLTDHWRPAFHSDVAAALASARCDYVGSATIDENFPQMSLSTAQRELWDEAPDRAARELIFDLCVKRAFRRDVFVRGARPVPREAVVDALWMASASHEDAEVVLRSQAGEAKLPPALVDAARAALAGGPKTIGALRALPGCSTATAAELAALLIGSGCAVPLWRLPETGTDWAHAVASARRFNAVSADRLAPHGIGGGRVALVSPALAGGLVADPFELAVARLVAEPPTPVAGAARSAVHDVDELIARLVPPGRTPDPPVLDELRTRIGALLQHRRPVWEAMSIV